jgi:hypothetical protein
MSVVSLKNQTLPPVCHMKCCLPRAAIFYILCQAWHETSLAHLIRPLKMRPAHPLPAPPSTRHKQDATKKQGAEEEAENSRCSEQGTRTRHRPAPVDLREGMLDGVVAAQPARPSQPTHPRSESLSSSVSVQCPPEESGPQRSKSRMAVDAKKGGVMPDLEKEKAHDPKFMMAIFGDDERHWRESNAQGKTTIPFPTRRTNHPMF